MTSLARSKAFEALLALEKTGHLPEPDNKVLGSDRPFYTQLIKGTLRQRVVIDRELQQYLEKGLESLPIQLQTILRMATFDMRFLSTPDYAAVNEAVELVPKEEETLRGLTNAVLRKVSQSQTLRLKPQNLYDVLPKPLAHQWITILGREKSKTCALLMQTEAKLQIRLNTTKGDVDKIVEAIAKDGLVLTETKNLPNAFFVENTTSPLHELSSFRDGLFYVQNEASMLPALILEPGAGQQVLDAFAAPGGKSTQIAELTKNNISLTCVDRSIRGLKRLDENFERLKLKKPLTKQMDFLAFDTREKFDRILLDAPCSAWGIFREHPEWRWRPNAKSPARQGDLQKKFLHNAMKFLKPGGVIVYSVCTFSKEETRSVIEAFMRERNDMKLEDVRPFLPKSLHSYVHDGFFQSYPGENHLDGFFIARMRKRI